MSNKLPFKKHLGLILDSQLSFEEHLKTIFSKLNKTIGLIRKLRNSLPRPPLMAPYIFYRLHRKLCYLYKTVVTKSPNYLFKVVCSNKTIYKARNTKDIPLKNIKYNFFKKTFSPLTITEWNKLDPATQNSTIFNFFKESILTFIRPTPNNIFHEMKYLTGQRVNFSHLRDHRFQHSFQDIINPLCTCSLEAETTNHFILHCPFYENGHHILLVSIGSIRSSILDENDNNIVKTFLYGLDSLSETQNTSILNATMEFLMSSNRFRSDCIRIK